MISPISHQVLKCLVQTEFHGERNPGSALQKTGDSRDLRTWPSTHACIAPPLCRSVHRKRGEEAGARQHDDDAEDLSPYHPGAGKSGRRSGDAFARKSDVSLPKVPGQEDRNLANK